MIEAWCKRHSEEPDKLNQLSCAAAKLLDLGVSLDYTATAQLLLHSALSLPTGVSTGAIANAVEIVVKASLNFQAIELTKHLKDPLCGVVLHFHFASLMGSLIMALTCFKHSDEASSDIIEGFANSLIQADPQLSPTDVKENGTGRKSCFENPFDETAFQDFLACVATAGAYLMCPLVEYSIESEWKPLLTELFSLMKSPARHLSESLKNVNGANFSMRSIVIQLLLAVLELEVRVRSRGEVFGREDLLRCELTVCLDSCC